MPCLFHDRVDAGQQLGELLRNRQAWPAPLVLGLPRGGVPVAAQVAQAIRAPLDVFLVRKLGVPGHEEVAFGAIASGGARWLNEAFLAQLRLGPETVAAVQAHEEEELHRRERTYRAGRTPLRLRGRTALLVDDGLATGATMQAALLAVRSLGPARTVVAVPVAPMEVCEALRRVADDVICLHAPLDFQAVGQFYSRFEQTSDAEVLALLREPV